MELFEETGSAIEDYAGRFQVDPTTGETVDTGNQGLDTTVVEPTVNNPVLPPIPELVIAIIGAAMVGDPGSGPPQIPGPTRSQQTVGEGECGYSQGQGDVGVGEMADHVSTDCDSTATGGSETGRGPFDVRPANPDHPPLDGDDVAALMEYTYHPGTDCSEIAQDLYDASGGQGRIIRYEPASGSMLRTPEAGGDSLALYFYHQVYTDGRYVYDPRFSSSPIQKGDYERMLRSLNPGMTSKTIPQ